MMPLTKATADKTPYLDIQNADVFQGRTQVFRNLNLQIRQGENVAILGPNGAGKTTLLKLLTRELYPVVKPESHVKLFGDERVLLWELRKKIGLVSQDFQNQYSAHIKGGAVVLSGFFGAVGVHGHHQVTQAHRDRASELMQQLGVSHLVDAFYAHLSTGQQRRLLLARALVHDPEVLVLDEPTNGLDLKVAIEFTHSLRHLAQTGKSLLLVTHHVQEIVPEIERVVLLAEGRVVADGPKKELLSDAVLSDLFDTAIRVVESGGFYQVLPG
jgi:iron complex transport system ATP-binding protein